MGASGSFPGGKAAGREADHSPSSSAEVKDCVDLYLHSPISLHGVVLRTTLPLPYENYLEVKIIHTSLIASDKTPYKWLLCDYNIARVKICYSY
jgi:hypothetical protein